MTAAYLSVEYTFISILRYTSQDSPMRAPRESAEFSPSRGNRRYAPPVTAPSLAAAGIETCLGSNSVGGSGSGFGVTIAGTVPDRPCNLRLFSRTLYNLGYRTAATQILCNDPDVAAALAIEDVHCNVGVAAEAVLRAETRAEAPAETPSRTAAICENYDLFRGCLDKPQPLAAAAAAIPPKRKLSSH